MKDKLKKVQLPQEQANEILGNVFSQADTDPNSVPLTVLESYSNYRVERYALQKSLLALLLVLFVLLPLMFVTADIHLEKDSRAEDTYLLTIDSFIPIRSINATIGDRNVPISEVEAHKYSLKPPTNGEMSVDVRLINRQSVTHYFTVEGLDEDPPVLVGSDYDQQLLNLYVEDGVSGVDFGSIYADSIHGRQSPIEVDPSTGRVTFPYPSENLNIYIPDLTQNVLHLIVSLR